MRKKLMIVGGVFLGLLVFYLVVGFFFSMLGIGIIDMTNDVHNIPVEPPITQPADLQPDDYTDIQTAEDDFEALDETLDELE